MQVCRVLHAFGAPSVLGSFARESEEYWVDYVGKCSDPRRSVVRLLFTPTAEGAKALQVGDCVGYAISEVLTFDLESIKKRVAEGGDVGTIGITIKEVFVGKVASLSSDGTVETVVAQSPQEFGNTLSHLVKSTIDRLLDSLPAGLEESLSIKLNVPAAVLPLDVLDAISNITSYEPWWKARELVAEDGWMFKVFESFSVADGADAQIFTAKDLAELLKPVGSSGLPFIGCEGVILKEKSDVFGFLKTDAF
ncbi:hypothetical protein HDU99_009197 [Rhizoclosmatium hyalinum]|nr:hypothetical protein HDU99_009197 [Rhizoclosmatium hyalinum]